MEYGLRVNHHAADHGRLIVDAIRPALHAIGYDAGRLRAALRPHWLDGPHVLVGLDVAADEAEHSWTVLSDAIAAWLDAEPARAPLDADAFRARAQALAALEGLSVADSSAIRPDRSVERGRYIVPHPLGVADLAPLRDAFKAATLDDVFELVELRLRSPADALIELAFRIVCLERLAWRDGLNFWPLSLQGQARASRDAATGAFAAKLAALQPAFAAQVAEERVLDAAVAPPARMTDWIARLQSTYAQLLRFLDTTDPAFVATVNARIVRDHPPDARALSKADAQTINAMNHPTQFAYRMLMNFIYDMFPAIGFTAGQRLLVCHLVTTTLETHHPDVLARSYADGAALCR